MTNFRALGKRLLCVLLAAACLLALAMPVAAVLQTRAAEPQAVYTTKIHHRAYASSAVIGQLEDGALITVLEEKSEFYKIDCCGMTGYIAKEQVRKDASGEYYVSCGVNSADTVVSPRTTLVNALQLRSSMLELAKQQLGTRYVYGGTAPGGFDCSGLMYYIYGNHGISLHRCADEQMQDGLIVSDDALQVGDLLFFREAGSPWLASHVGIYAGNGQMIHAGNSGIEYADLSKGYYKQYYICARRIVNVGVAAVDTLPTVTTQSTAGIVSSGLRTAQ